MKRKLAMVTLAMSMALTAAACGNTQEKEGTVKEEETAGEDAKEGEPASEGELRLTAVQPEEMSKYLALGEYKNIEVNAAAQDISDAEVDIAVEGDLMAALEPVPEGVVEEGDIANIDYQGMRNGEAFEGGTAENYDLSIGSGQFIEGFEDGLIGAKAGEELDLNLTFPEAYPSEELAGQDVVFHVTVNEVKRKPELSEEWVKANTDFDTVEAYREDIRKDLKEKSKADALTAAKANAWNQVYEASQVKEYPQEDLDRELAAYDEMIQAAVTAQGMTLEQVLEAQDMTQEDYEADKQQYAEAVVKQNLVIQAIMDQEGLTFDSEEGQAAKEEMLAQQGAASLEDMAAQFGESSTNQAWGITLAGNFIMENANVTETIETEDGKNGEDMDS